jgi:hypothetical protein
LAFALKKYLRPRRRGSCASVSGIARKCGELPKRPVGWKKMKPGPGETQEMTVSIELRALAIFDVARDVWEIVPDEYRVFVGGSSRETPFAQSFRVEPAQAVVFLKRGWRHNAVIAAAPPSLALARGD